MFAGQTDWHLIHICLFHGASLNARNITCTQYGLEIYLKTKQCCPGDSRSSSVHSPLESWAQQMLWRRNFLIQSPNLSTASLGTRDWKVLIRAESLGMARSLDDWEGCVCAFGGVGRGAGAHFTDVCVYMCVLHFSPVCELSPVASLSTVFICGFHRMMERKWDIGSYVRDGGRDR